MNTQTNNLFSDIPPRSEEELFITLLEKPGVRIERIVSYGQSSPEGFWYDQAWDEWVLLIQGSAELDLGEQCISLKPGDHLLIPAGQKHRVSKTDPDQTTIWLAAHFDTSARN